MLGIFAVTDNDRANPPNPDRIDRLFMVDRGWMNDSAVRLSESIDRDDFVEIVRILYATRDVKDILDS